MQWQPGTKIVDREKFPAFCVPSHLMAVEIPKREGGHFLSRCTMASFRLETQHEVSDIPGHVKDTSDPSGSGVSPCVGWFDFHHTEAAVNSASSRM